METVESRFELLAALETAFCLVDAESAEIAYANPAFEKLAGFDGSSRDSVDLYDVFGDEEAVETLLERRARDRGQLELEEDDSAGAVTVTVDGYVDGSLVLKAGERSAADLTHDYPRLHAISNAETQQELEHHLVEALEAVGSPVTVYSYDGGDLTSDDAVSVGREDPAWEAFTSSEPKLTRHTDTGGRVTEAIRPGLFEAASADDGADGSVEELRVDVPFGRKKVVSAEIEDGSEAEAERAVALVEAAEAASERLGLEQEVEELQEGRAEVERELEMESQLNQLLADVVYDVRNVVSKDDVRDSLCERLLEIDCWDFAWIVEGQEDVSPACTCDRIEVDQPFVDRLSNAYSSDSPTATCLEDGETQVVNDVASHPRSDWRRASLNAGYMSAASVPLGYGKRSFGALEVYSEQAGCFDGRSITVLEEIAGLLAFAMVTAERTRSLLSDDYQRLTLELDPEKLTCYFSQLVQKLDTEAYITSVVPEEKRTLAYFECDAEERDIYDASDEIGVSVERSMNGYVAEVSRVSIVEEAMEVGGRVSRYGFEDGDVQIDVNLPREVDAGDLLEVVRKRHPGAELAARRYSFDEFTPDSVLEDLTERQETVLRLAYDEGFFESPRERTGDEIADELDITATTFHQHLRAAEKTLVSSLLEGDAEQ